MATSDYQKGSMEVGDKHAMFDGMIRWSAWGSVIILAALAYSTLTLSMGMNWLIALALTTGGGIVAGLVMGFGGAWIATMVGLAALAVIIQIIIMLVSLAL